MFGEEGLKSGVPVAGQSGEWTAGYSFHGDAEKVFKEFFGGDNPFQGTCNYVLLNSSTIPHYDIL